VICSDIFGKNRHLINVKSMTASESFYSPQRVDITVEAGSRARTVFHESAHLFDHQMTATDAIGQTIGSGKWTSQNFRSADGMLRNAITDDFEALLDKHGIDIRDAADLNGILRKEIPGWDKLEGPATELSDMLSGASGNTVRLRYKHDASYWARPGSTETEAFANMFSASIRSEEAYNLILNYFPNSAGVFEQIVGALW
jgi:hypothetical protein